ncbi:MAG: signal peptidase I [Candidatus Omnitrophota bacterium]|jgi:signal peptidase I
MKKLDMNEFMELSEEVLSRALNLRFRMKGTSMFPTLQDDDIIIIKKFDISNIHNGDIIFFRPPFHEGVTHRVIRKVDVKGRQAFITKGDFCPFFDGYVYPEHILGRVVAIERKGKSINLDKKTTMLKAAFYTRIICFQVGVYSVLRGLRNRIYKLLGVLLRLSQRLKIYDFFITLFADTKPITYRLASHDDAPLLAQLYSAYYWPARTRLLIRYLQQYLKDVSRNQGYCFLSQKGNRVIGSVAVQNFSSDELIQSGWTVCSPFVNWRYRGMGIENKLVELAKQKAKEQGAVEIKMAQFDKTHLTFS